MQTTATKPIKYRISRIHRWCLYKKGGNNNYLTIKTTAECIANATQPWDRVLPARSLAISAQQLDGTQQRQNRVRNQLHQILLHIQTPPQRRRNHQRPAGTGEGE